MAPPGGRDMTDAAAAPQTFDVGWFMYEDQGAFLFIPPRPAGESAPPPPSRKAVRACPAVRGLEARAFDILSPYNLDLTVERSGDRFAFYVAPNRTSVDPGQIARVLTVNERHVWRTPDRPVVQVALPYCFVADADVELTQIAPLGGARFGDGIAVIPGRFPIRSWIRPMSLAFEFQRLPGRLTFRRGEALCTLVFDGPAPSALPRLVRARKTAEVTTFMQGCVGVTSRISDTPSAMARAEAARPPKLLEAIDD